MLRKLGFLRDWFVGSPFHCGVRMPEGPEGPEGPRDDDAKPRLDEICRQSGRRVARDPAVMAKPCSMSDQIAMSTVAQRKSGFLKSIT